MRLNLRRTSWLAALTAVLALGLLSQGCDDGTLTPSDGTLFLSVNPGSVTIDIAAGEESGTTTVEARVFNAAELPLKDASVTFTSNGGRLASATNSCLTGRCSLSGDVCVVDGDCPSAPAEPVLTDSAGIARDVLTVGENDASEIELTATSGSLMQSFTVEVIKIRPPGEAQARINIDPSNQQRKGAPVSFDGLDSIFDDTVFPTCYQWTIASTEPSSNETVHDTSATLTRTYNVEQELTVELRVSDDPTIDCTRSGTPDPALFSPFSDSTTYSIVCDLTEPTADPVAGGGNSYNGSVNNAIAVDGSDSSDPDSTIVAWEWDCDTSDTASTEAPTGETATCTYDRVGNFTIRLTVRNECGLEGTTTANVAVTN